MWDHIMQSLQLACVWPVIVHTSLILNLIIPGPSDCSSFWEETFWGAQEVKLSIGFISQNTGKVHVFLKTSPWLKGATAPMAVPMPDWIKFKSWCLQNNFWICTHTHELNHTALCSFLASTCLQGSVSGISWGLISSESISSPNISNTLTLALTLTSAPSRAFFPSHNI